MFKLSKYILIFIISSVALAEGRGEISFNYRSYFEDKESQPSDLQFVKFIFEEQSTWYGFDFNLSVIGRADEKYQENSYLDINELNISKSFGDLTFEAGNKIYTWSKMESFHPVEVINSRVNDGNIEKFEKLGELSLNVDLETDIGNFQVLYMPYFKESFFPDKNMRLFDGFKPNDILIVSGDDISSDDQRNQFGFNFSTQIGDLDLAAFVLNHIDRTRPVIGAKTVPDLIAGKIDAYYREVVDYGAAATFFWGEHTLKGEFLHSDFNVDDTLLIETFGGTRKSVDYQTISVGHEYTYTYSNNWSSSFYTEYQTILGVDNQTKTELDIFQNDIFIGHRLAFNDAFSRELMLGIYYDFERSNEMLYYLSYERRLSNTWKGKVSLRAATIGEDAKQDKRGLYILDGDNEAGFLLTRFF